MIIAGYIILFILMLFIINHTGNKLTTQNLMWINFTLINNSKIFILEFKILEKNQLTLLKIFRV